MGIFLTILQYALGLLPSVVLGVQTIVGDSASGKDKLTMAKDALAVALQGANSAITDPKQLALANAAAGTVATVLASAGAINAAVTHTKATGAYQAATDSYNTSQAPQAPSSTTTPVPASPAASQTQQPTVGK